MGYARDKEIKMHFDGDRLYAYVESMIDRMDAMCKEAEAESTKRWATGAKSAFYQVWLHLLEKERKFLHETGAGKKLRQLRTKRRDPYFDI